MMAEKNKATLENAIRQLPQYEPAPALWERISSELEEQTLFATAPRQLPELPSYSPPPEVWENIQAQLDREADQVKEAPVRHLPSRKRWLRVAAAIAVLLIGLSWFFLNRDQAATVTVAYSEEEMPPVNLIADWNDDEDIFREVVSAVEQHPLLRDQPEMRNLQQELEELDDAKAEVESMIDRYGNDASLIRQIGEIERERSQVLKQIASAI